MPLLSSLFLPFSSSLSSFCRILSQETSYIAIIPEKEGAILRDAERLRFDSALHRHQKKKRKRPFVIMQESTAATAMMAQWPKLLFFPSGWMIYQIEIYWVEEGRNRATRLLQIDKTAGFIINLPSASYAPLTPHRIVIVCERLIAL